MRIQIHIPYPIETALVFGLMGWFMYSSITSPSPMVSASALEKPADTQKAETIENVLPPQGGNTTPPQSVVKEAETRSRSARVAQQLLERKEEILRYELEQLESRQMLHTDTMSEDTTQLYLAGIAELRSLLLDKQAAEQVLLESFHQIWEAQGRAVALGAGLTPRGLIRLIWPVAPTLGISAHFDDAGYQQRFGFAHNAIDIPVDQGSIVTSAADGVVELVRDNGLGFNSITIRHDGYVTLYGHVESFLVQEGQEVRVGEPIAYSGGMPGTPGAGRLTTGPHLHFELIVDGQHVDPELYLPSAD